MQGKRYFNLTYRPKYFRDKKEEVPNATVSKIQRSVPSKQEDESPLGNFLIRLILCISLFSGIMLMKNSSDQNVVSAYNIIKAWAECNYSVPEEYGIEKFVQAIKQGNLSSVFSPDMYPALRFPSNGTISVNYGEKDSNGGECLGIMISSDTECDIFSSINGIITDIGSNGVIGNYITVEADGEVTIIYGCCDRITVSVGDSVDTDTVIAQQAKGKDEKYYMYMEVHINGNTVNPTLYFNGDGKSA